MFTVDIPDRVRAHDCRPTLMSFLAKLALASPFLRVSRGSYLGHLWEEALAQ